MFQSRLFSRSRNITFGGIYHITSNRIAFTSKIKNERASELEETLRGEGRGRMNVNGPLVAVVVVLLAQLPGDRRDAPHAIPGSSSIHNRHTYRVIQTDWPYGKKCSILVKTIL